MSVFKHPNSPYYQIEFYIDGRPVRGSSKTPNKKEAEALEKVWRAQKLADAEHAKRTGSGPMTFGDAVSLYWHEKGQHLKNSDTVWTDLNRMLGFLGGDRRLDAITNTEIAALVAWRRTHTKSGKVKNAAGEPMPLITPATVNRSTTALAKAVFTNAKLTGQQLIPHEPKWRAYWLKEPKERVRELHEGEGEALDAAIRDDYRLWLEFVALTGMRFDETLIKWSDVNVFAKKITTKGKGGHTVSTPITSAVKAILDQCRGHNKTWVFTYICRRAGNGRVKGQRYPITYENAKTQWRRGRERSGVQDFRLHDYRHDVATKLLRATGNLKLVQMVLSHQDIKTTAKYAAVLETEVGAALEQFAKSRKNPRTDLKQVG